MKQNAKWLLDCPRPEGGVLAEGFYNAGPMFADDRHGATDEDTHIQIITEASRTDFENYVAQLNASGIRGHLEHSLGRDRFFAYQLEGKDYHVSWSAGRNQLRIAQGPARVSLKDFGYRAKGDRTTTFYQYGLYYDPDNNMTPKTANCGMLYVIRLSDNSLFMIDGGFYLQWNEEAAEGLWQFLRHITDTPENGTVRIAGWYFTHTHADHIDGCVKLLNRHHDQIRLERMLFNFPLYDVLGGYEPSRYYVGEQLSKWYPDVKVLKLHTGQIFHLADMQVEVLYTQEDGVAPEEITRFPMRDGNCMSSILKLTVNGKTILMLGDTNLESEAFLTRTSSREIWKADMVQLAHHCFNFLDTLYEWIEAPAIVVPNSYGGAHQPENVAKLEGALKYMKDDRIWYEGGGTDGFIAAEEGWKHVAHYPLIGGEYDGSGY